VLAIDSTACDEMLRLVEELRGRGVTLSLARVRDRVREVMRRGGIEAAVGPANFYDRVTDGVRAWQKASQVSALSPAESGSAARETE
jgi:MFS superfamily sulfate permease-like transporter